MNAKSFLQSKRPIRREAPTHQFAIGQSVRLKGGFARPPQTAEIFYVTATLPPRGDSPQYRIRNDEERYERVTTQDSLELVAAPESGDDATLIERTFGHGQGAETQQPQSEEADTGTNVG